MDIGPPTIYFCPSCKKPMAETNFTSYNAGNSVYFSDGVMAGYPPFSADPGKCPNCGRLVFLKSCRSKKLGMLDNWRQYPRIDDPELDDYVKAVKEKLAKTNEEEIILRTRLWHALNDKIRFRYREPEKDIRLNDDDMNLWLSNCKALLNCLREKAFKLLEIQEKNIENFKEDKYYCVFITIAELQRNIGEFDKCLKNIANLPDYYRALKKQYAGQCAKKEQRVFVIEPTEDGFPSMMELCP